VDSFSVKVASLGGRISPPRRTTAP